MVFLEYAQVARRVCKVRVMVLEYAPRISGTRHGFRVRKGMRRCYRVRVIVLGCAPVFLEYAQVTRCTRSAFFIIFLIQFFIVFYCFVLFFSFLL
jgi:hypothetical protein